jgi:hypothetical protein
VREPGAAAGLRFDALGSFAPVSRWVDVPVKFSL